VHSAVPATIAAEMHPTESTGSDRSLQLLAHIAALPTPLEMVHAVVCVHIVYGWMPTILDPLGVSKAVDENANRLLEVLNAARSAKEPRLTDDDLGLLRGFANNSTVGASKLLHFLNPCVYPIWDSRVANRYLWSGVSRETFDNESRLWAYMGTLWDWSRDPTVKAACAALNKACPNTKGCTTVRLMELVLFHPPLPQKLKTRRPAKP
jgi:hypothetical protein